LRDEHAVERVAVMSRQATGGHTMARGDREIDEAVDA
jgi:hypothetical protein